MPPGPTYQSYLLRFWRATPQGSWQASLQCTATNAQYSFRELTDLFAFLTTRMVLGDVTVAVANEDPRDGDA